MNYAEQRVNALDKVKDINAALSDFRYANYSMTVIRNVLKSVLEKHNQILTEQNVKEELVNGGVSYGFCLFYRPSNENQLECFELAELTVLNDTECIIINKGSVMIEVRKGSEVHKQNNELFNPLFEILKQRLIPILIPV